MTLRIKLSIAGEIALLVLCSVGVISYQWTLREDEGRRFCGGHGLGVGRLAPLEYQRLRGASGATAPYRLRSCL
jgi:hypothetical protein